MKLTRCLLFLIASALFAQSLADLQRGFQTPPDDARMMMRWWWFGPAVEPAELEREMRAMKAGGIGGFEVQPVYPLEVEGNYPYLCDRFLENLRFAAGKAKELGLRFDLTLCSGWPYGGPHISLAQASSRIRVSKTEPTLAEGESLIAAVAQADGSKLWFVASHTRQTVKRSAVGAEGWVLDHYSKDALATHLKAVGEKLFGAIGKDTPYAVFSDSLEVYGADWTPNFLDEFRKRRGYDLTPYLPALAGDIGEKTASVRHDWGKTLSELADANYLTPLREWARQHGTRLRSQTYGIPPVTLSSNALVDLPEGEGTQWRAASSTRWATSASHLYGRNVTSSETWTWLNSPVFRATPLDMKVEADLHFLQGVNQLVGHGWPYSPPSAGEPGWRFYAAAVFNDHNPWYIAMPDVAAYMQRISWLLRQGEPVNDVAVYLPTSDAFASFALGRPSVNQAMDKLIGPTVIPQILENGYNFDFIDDESIAKVGVKYKALVLPGVERIPLATLEKITKLPGVTVIATRHAPSLAPGLMEQERDTPKVRELARGLKVIADEKLGEALKAALKPDLASAPEIGFVHRHTPDAEIYFVVNTSNRPVITTPRFRVDGMAPAQWNPLTGEAATFEGAEFNLAPYESRVVVFSRGVPTRKTGSRPFATVDLSAGWKVSFPDGAVDMPELRSWISDPARRFYSGTATYERKVNVPSVGDRVFLSFGEGTPIAREDRRAGAGMRAMMDGPVRDAAIVYVNGQRAGAVWCSPFEVEVTRFLKSGENSIRVVVANSALNNMAMGPLPDYKALTAKYGERFQAQDMQSVVPQPSGLLGPVRLIGRP
jgi:hypothetical protein